MDFVEGVFELVILVFSISFHECAHAWTAWRLGDPTARMLGRVTLNPKAHVDPIGTLLIPAVAIFGPLLGVGFFTRFLIGWGKPTPVTTRNFRKITRDDALVSLAGPASNLLLALLSFCVFAVFLLVTHAQEPEPGTMAGGIPMLCSLAIEINLMLFFFNLIPIPPLDGSHLLRNILPYGALKYYDNLGMLQYVLLIGVGAPVAGVLMQGAMALVYALLDRI